MIVVYLVHESLYLGPVSFGEHYFTMSDRPSRWKQFRRSECCWIIPGTLTYEDFA